MRFKQFNRFKMLSKDVDSDGLKVLLAERFERNTQGTRK